jgi:demethylmenaquinone methyltransferase/2-methoxy-6-polyprenyl-1,4-benzoquinol methylase
MMRTMKPSLAGAFDRPEDKRRYVRRLFGTIADRYDLITRLLSFGQDGRWKRRLVALGAIRPGEAVLDLACGTGDLAFGATARGARVVGLDITPRMVELAARNDTRYRFTKNVKRYRVSFLVGDMGALPLASASFDCVTTGYGLRNVPDLSRALAEIHRVLRPNGRLLSLDFNRPEARWLRAIYLGYLTMVGSTLGWILHRDPDTYRYIPASIRRYPGARGVADLMRATGFVDVRVLPVFGGLLTIHVARK